MRKSVLFLAALLWTGAVLGQSANGPASPLRNPTPLPLPADPGSPQVSNATPSVVARSDAGSPPGGGRPASLLPPEPLGSFDPSQADVQWTGNHWKLVAGSVAIKDLDRREPEARETVRVIRELHLTQYGAIGTPRPVMEYWLADGQAPTARTPGLRVVSFDPIALRAEVLQGQWCVRDARRIYFNFGPHPEDARRALEVIRQHGFNQIGYVGQPVPAMIYFLAGPTPATAGPLTARPANSGPPAPNPLPAGLQGAAMPQAGAAQPITPTAHVATPTSPRLPPGSSTPLPDLASLANRVPIDWHQVQVRQDKQEWKLFFGNYLLASFGNSERDARLALAALRYYRLTEHCLIGKPQPSFTYYLANGQVPRGLMIGMHATAFRPDQLSVQRVGASYILTDGYQTLLNFGDKADDARETLQVIQRHQCDHLCHIGSSETNGMRLLVRVK